MYLIPITGKPFYPINPVQFGYEACEKGHHFGPAVRTHYLIHFVVSGCGRFEINNKSYKISAGEMFVIPPLAETYYKADEKTPWNYIWIGFEAETLPIALSDKITCPAALPIFLDMKSCEEYEGGKKLFLSAKILELFSVLEKAQKREESYVEKAKSFMCSEYMMGIGVDDIAKRLGLNRSYFSDIFKKETGMSPAKYLMRHRMSVARSLLCESKKSVAVTAHSVGYTDVFTFSKAFKKYWGKSPAECIKNESL